MTKMDIIRALSKSSWKLKIRSNKKFHIRIKRKQVKGPERTTMVGSVRKRIRNLIQEVQHPIHRDSRKTQNTKTRTLSKKQQGKFS